VNQLLAQVRKAHRRLLVEQFLATFCWTSGGAFLLAAVVVAVDRYWPLGVAVWVWFVAAAALAVVAAVGWTWLRRRSRLDAAIELDRRFALKERVSSALALSKTELASPAGEALVRDAIARSAQLDVRSRFRPTMRRWQPLLPLLPLAVAVILALFVDQVVREEPAEAKAAEAQKEQIRRTSEELRKRIAQQKKAVLEKDLKELEAPLGKIEKELEKLSRSETADKKDALLKLSDLAEDLQQRRTKVGGVEQVRRQLEGLKAGPTGPADEMAKAIRDGDFSKAADQVKKLQDELKDAKLNDQQREQLAKQMADMQQKLDQIAQAHEQAQKDLQEKVDQLRKQGDNAQADQLQKKLDQLQQQAPQMQQLQQLAQKLGDCSQCLNPANGQQGAQQAADQLAQMADQLDQLQKDADAMETLDQTLDQISQAKESMACKQCNGAGCEACQGQGMGQGKGQKQGQGQQVAGGRKGQGNGDGLGEGQGHGLRPENDNKVGFRDSQIRPDVQPGKIVAIGSTGGPNAKGQVQQVIAAETQAAAQSQDNPLTGQTLPRGYRDNAQQYFDARRGEK